MTLANTLGSVQLSNFIHTVTHHGGRGRQYRKAEDEKERERKGGSPSAIEQVFTVQICFVYCWRLQAQASNHCPSSFTQLFSLRDHDCVGLSFQNTWSRDVYLRCESWSVEGICHKVIKLKFTLNLWLILHFSDNILCFVSVYVCAVCQGFSGPLFSVISFPIILKVLFTIMCWHIFLKQTRHIKCASFKL